MALWQMVQEYKERMKCDQIWLMTRLYVRLWWLRNEFVGEAAAFFYSCRLYLKYYN